MSHLKRVVILIDMDCFYCQVEEKLDSALEGKPIAVVQYNPWRGGGIIAVNYAAREKGVTRHMYGDDAKKKCPEIILPKVPEVRGKADLTKYRDAGKRVADVLQTFTPLLERASVDEAYLDVTDAVLKRMENMTGDITIDKVKNTHVVGCETVDFLENLKNNAEFSNNNLKLCIGAVIAEEIRAAVLKQTGYTCSAGIAHNKILAKLTCGLHKPNKQTILPHDAIPEYFKSVPISKITGLGGKFGQEVVDELGVSNMEQLANFSENQLIQKFGKKNGSWLYNIARGIDLELVVTKLISKSIGCCKRFLGKASLLTLDSIQHWMNELATEISERLEKDLEENNRKAKQMTVSFAQEIDNKNICGSRVHPLNSYEKSKIAQDAVEIVKKSCQKQDGSYNVTFLGISVGNFQDLKKTGVSIASFFQKAKNTNSPETTTKALEKSSDTPNIDDDIVNEDYNNGTNKSYEGGINKTDDCDIYESGDDINNHSIYSASTEDLEDDPKSYIYFEDIFPEFVSSQPLQSSGSVEGENQPPIEQLDKEKVETRDNSSRSFFNRYFDSPENKRTCDPEQANTDDVNAMHCHEKEFVDNENMFVGGVTSIQQIEQSEICNLKRKSSDSDIFQHYGQREEELDTYPCPDCKKNIPIIDILEHSDYHVAKKLQAEMQLSSRSSNPHVSNKKTKKSPSVTITKFFKPV